MAVKKLKSTLKPKTTAATSGAEITQEQTSLRAYYIWQREGCPTGRAHEHWALAVAELKAAKRPTAAAPAAPKRKAAKAAIVKKARK
jgi:hypothetical protein